MYYIVFTIAHFVCKFVLQGVGKGDCKAFLDVNTGIHASTRPETALNIDA
ncbi:MAG: hypothetical protein RL273_632 [Bacteroidota bacterium]|jgi:hypothetical protein